MANNIETDRPRPQKRAYDFLLASDAARIAECSAAGIRAASRRGSLRVAARTVGGVNLYALADIETWQRGR